MDTSDLGVLVVGHGTRDPIGQAQMRNLACQTAGCLAPVRTDLGFLELAEPTIEQGIERLAAAGVRRLITLPVLLFRAGHADRDIPEAVQAAADRFGVQVLGQTAPLEHQAAVVELSAQRFDDALATLSADDGQATMSNQLNVGRDVSLAMIARGSSSESAAAAMQRFAELRCELRPVAECQVGYVAVRQPNVKQTLDWLAATNSSVLVVQPHLLFEGEVYHSLCRAVAERQRNDTRKWLISQPLGAPVEQFEDDRLAHVLAQLCQHHIHRK